MVHYLHQPDEFTSVHHQFGVLWQQLSAEECHRPSSLVQNITDTASQRIVVNARCSAQKASSASMDHRKLSSHNS
jgi:hypothetical protein